MTWEWVVFLCCINITATILVREVIRRESQ